MVQSEQLGSRIRNALASFVITNRPRALKNFSQILSLIMSLTAFNIHISLINAIAIKNTCADGAWHGYSLYAPGSVRVAIMSSTDLNSVRYSMLILHPDMQANFCNIISTFSKSTSIVSILTFCPILFHPNSILQSGFKSVYGTGLWDSQETDAHS